jgi:hypothetical protein
MYLICPNCGLMREAQLATVHVCGRCRARGETVYLSVLPSLNPRDQRSPTPAGYETGEVERPVA